MVYLYGEKDRENADKKYKKSLCILIFMTALFLIASASICVVYALQDYETPLRTPLLIAVIALSFLYIAFVVLFRDLCLNKDKRYKKFIYAMPDGISPERVNVFIRKEYNGTVKDGVDGISLIFLEWSEKEHEFFETQIYLDSKKDGEYFSKGDKVKHVKYANFLVGYEIVNKV